MDDLTVFVGTFNRTDTLQNCIRNLEAQDYPLRIVIVDNGTKDHNSLAYLDDLTSGYSVYYLPPNEEVETTDEDERNHGGRTMSAVARNYSAAMTGEWERKTDWFAVCDSDTAPDGAAESIAVYRWLAEELNVAAGPHMSLNIHQNYPLRSLALILNARVLFRDRFLWHDDIPYTFDDIDSTFHLFPAEPNFRRLGMRTVRVGPPYWTTHTDWLFDVLNPTEENLSYVFGSSAAASWTGDWMREWFRAWLRSPEEALELSLTKRHVSRDYCLWCFYASWMFQHGHGCEVDLDRSRALLRKGTPKGTPPWQYEQHWDALVYDNDQSCLGWG